MRCPIDYVLTQQELELCINFARDSAPTQQDYEFGERSTGARTAFEISRDNLIGKIAEVAFKNIIEANYPSIPEINLDFEVYERGKYDEQDASINGYNIDVKGTREGGRWFLIEWNKLRFRSRENKLPQYFAAFSVGWDRLRDYPSGKATFQGLIPIAWLSFPHAIKEARIEILRKDSFIPNTGTRLQTDNYGIRFCHLIRSDKGINACINNMVNGKEKEVLDFILPE